MIMASSRRSHVGTSNEASHSVFTHRGHLGKFIEKFVIFVKKMISRKKFSHCVFFQILVPNVHQMKNTLEVRDRAIYQQI